MQLLGTIPPVQANFHAGGLVHAPLLVRFVSRIAGRHLIWHLLVPLAVGALVEAFVAAGLARLHGTEFGGFRSYFISLERLGLFVGVFMTFSVVLYWHMQQEAEITRLTFGPVLESALGSARSFFALATTPVKEWFEPSTQLYFATLVQHQLDDKDFQHVRTLVLFTKTDSLNMRAPLLDENYARAFAKLHELSDAQLAYIERPTIFPILDSLSVADRKAVGCYRRWQRAFIRTRLLERIPLNRLRRRIRELAIGLVEYRDREPRILIFSKRGSNLGIRVVEANQGEGLAFRKLLEAVREEVMEPAPMALDPAAAVKRAIKPQYDLIATFR